MRTKREGGKERRERETKRERRRESDFKFDESSTN